jgi:hypothetical protein
MRGSRVCDKRLQEVGWRGRRRWERGLRGWGPAGDPGAGDGDAGCTCEPGAMDRGGQQETTGGGLLGRLEEMKSAKERENVVVRGCRAPMERGGPKRGERRAREAGGVALGLATSRHAIARRAAAGDPQRGGACRHSGRPCGSHAYATHRIFNAQSRKTGHWRPVPNPVLSY